MIRSRVSYALMIFAVIVFLVPVNGAEVRTVTPVVPGVWFVKGDLEGQGQANSVIVEMKDYLIVVDAGFPGAARLTSEDARKLSPKPVKYVFLTNHHGDYSYGASVWANAGATTIASTGMAEEMKRYEPARWQAASKQRKDVAEMHLSSPPLPKQTFAQGPFILKDSTREVRFYFFGWASTRGDGFVYLPKEKILCTGDAVLNGPYNKLGDGNIGNWPTAINAAEKLDFTIVLPGHGKLGGREILDGQRNFLTDLYQSVQDAMKQGRNLDDIVKRNGDRLTSTSIPMPADVKNWVGVNLPYQVRDVYQEISQHKPIGDLPHTYE